MTEPIIAIPSQFVGATLSKFAENLLSNCPEGWPAALTLDFRTLRFIKPAGTVFLSNLIWWLHEKGTRVNLINFDYQEGAHRYLDDSQFFEQHCGSKIWQTSTPRSTTKPLMRIAQSESHGWLELDLLPWLAGRIGIAQASFYDLKSCLSELFNNIKEHTRFDIGSIFVQHYPRENGITISIADFGLGIPEKVRETVAGLSDTDAVVQAVQEGFTSRSIPGNAGLGLDYLLKTVVGTNDGEVTIYSGHAIVRFKRTADSKIRPFPILQVGFCPGTTIDINLRTDRIVEVLEQREELQW